MGSSAYKFELPARRPGLRSLRSSSARPEFIGRDRYQRARVTQSDRRRRFRSSARCCRPVRIKRVS